MKAIKHIYICLTLTMVVFLAACTAEESSHDQRQERVLHLKAGWQKYGDVPFATTRTSFQIGTGDNAISYETLSADGASIRVYITTSGRLDFYGDFTYSETEGEWTQKVPFDNDTYYIYGFMPSRLMNSTTIEARSDNNYANGAVLTIGNVPSLMKEDFCAIVGVKRADNKTGNIASSGIQRGVYEYNVTRSDNDNYAYLLLDHVYACLRFTMAVDETYNTLRKIHLKRFSITPQTASFKVTATLLPNNFTTLQTAFTKTAEGGTEQHLWEGDKDILLPSTAEEKPIELFGSGYQDLYIAPTNVNTDFTITCTYDVYDKSGKNLIRKDCEATNKISLGGASLQSGDRYTIPLVIMPTYLYVLSEPDLDNPSITF